MAHPSFKELSLRALFRGAWEPARSRPAGEWCKGSFSLGVQPCSLETLPLRLGVGLSPQRWPWAPASPPRLSPGPSMGLWKCRSSAAGETGEEWAASLS